MEKFLEDLKNELNQIESYRFKENLSKSPLVCETALMALAEIHYSFVREAVASNPNTPPEALRKMAEDEVPFVRACAARNPRLPEEARIRLLNDDNDFVRRAAASVLTTPDLVISCARGEDWNLRYKAAKNPLLPEEEKLRLLDDECCDVRSTSAAHLAEDVDLFRRLARQTDLEIRQALARNLNLTDRETARALASDLDEVVRYNLAGSGSRGADSIRMRLAFDNGIGQSRSFRKPRLPSGRGA